MRHILKVANAHTTMSEKSFLQVWTLTADPAAPRPTYGQIHRSEVDSYDHTIRHILEPTTAFHLKSVEGRALEIENETRGLNQDVSMNVERAMYMLQVILDPVVFENDQTVSSSLSTCERICEAFVRDRHVFGRSTGSRYDEDMDIKGPQFSWRTPEQACLGKDSCFSNRRAASPPTKSRARLYPSKSNDGYHEAMYLEFDTELGDVHDSSSEPSKSLLAYRKQLLSHKSCRQSWIIDYATTPNKFVIVTGEQQETAITGVL